MKVFFLIVFVSGLFLGGFWYMTSYNQTFSSVDGGMSFNYPAYISSVNSSGTMDGFEVSLRETSSDGYLNPVPLITVSIVGRGSNVPLDKWLLMRGEKTWSHSVTLSVSIYRTTYDGFSYGWSDGDVSGKAAVLDVGDRVCVIVVYKTTPEALRAFNTVLSNIHFALKK